MNHKTITIKGKLVDDQTRCVHYQSELDIIAIKFKCCDTYYPCYSCHQEDADHLAQIWRKRTPITRFREVLNMTNSIIFVKCDTLSVS